MRVGTARRAVLVISFALAAACGDTSTPPPVFSSGGSGGSAGAGGTAGTGGVAGTGGTAGSGGTAGAGGTAGTGGMSGGGGMGGSAAGGGSGGPCVTSAVCHTCPDELLCNNDNDCQLPGYVCVPSGCQTLGGASINTCLPSWAGSCNSDADCPDPGDYDCSQVGLGGKRCVRVAQGCDASTETFDCAPGFSCEGGNCVDRRMPCDSALDCPKSHICMTTPTSTYCTRVYRTCHVDDDCRWLGVTYGESCVDVDNDGTSECTGDLASTGAGCLNDNCGDPDPVCENVKFGTATTAVCGDYGLCRNNNDCDVDGGFECVGLWQDGRKECVKDSGPSNCSQVTQCPLGQVCASTRDGSAPNCQAGSGT